MEKLKMKAAFLEKLHSPLIVDVLEVPELSVGQVLVRIMASGVCGKQLGEIAGAYGEDKYLPHLMGHEGGGIVMEIGTGVKYVQKNDRVVVHWRKGIGIDSAPPKYKRNTGFVGGGWNTTFNEYSVVSENRLTPVPKDIPFDVAALMGCAVTTGLGLVIKEAELKPGQSIAVFGSGGVGINVIQGASLVSAYPIIAIDKVESKLEMARKFGATHVVNVTKSNVREEIAKIVGRGGLDIFAEFTGNVENIALAYELTSSSGKTILVGQPHYDKSLTIPNMAKHFGGKMMFASQGGLTSPREDIPKYLDLYSKGKLDLKGLITHRFKLEDINTALEKMRTGEITGRCIIDMGE